MNPLALENIGGLTQEENTILEHLLIELRRVSPNNNRRHAYFNSEQTIRHLGVSVPREYSDLYSILGWSRKGVESLASRIKFQGVSLGSDLDPYGIQTVLNRNDFEVESVSSVISALTYGVSFFAVTEGGPGEPEILISQLSPLSTVGVWNQRLKRVEAALTINSSENGQPNSFTLYTTTHVIEAYRSSGGKWEVNRTPHRLGRAPISAIRFQPNTEKPLGHSFISKPIMGLTDRAARNLLRSEIHAEYFANPKRYGLNLPEYLFEDESGAPTAFNMAASAFMMFPPQEEDTETGVVPPEIKFGQFDAASLEPHLAELQEVTSAAAAELLLPPSALGIRYSQPESSEALQTAFNQQIELARDTHTAFGAGFRDLARLIFQVQENTDQIPTELWSLRSSFRDAAPASQAARTDAVIKLVQSGVLPASSVVTYKQLNLSDAEIDQLQADQRRAQAQQRIQALSQVNTSALFPPTQEGDVNDNASDA